MFGYVNVNKADLSQEEQGIYQSMYCGLCQRLRESNGLKGRALLSFDMTFLVLLLTGLYEPQTEAKEYSCPVHPFKKNYFLLNEVTDYAADMNVILAYHNLEDDWQDDKNLLKHGLAVTFRERYSQIADRYPRQVQAVEEYMRRTAECEARQESNLDQAAMLTGEMLGELFAWKQDEWYDELKLLGMYLGKFIYLMDAWEDRPRDEKKDFYNPLRALYKEHPAEYEGMVRQMLTQMMAGAAASFERLPILTHAGILRNILYSGVWSRYELLQRKNQKKRN